MKINRNLLISFALVFSFILFIIWNRLIRVRTPKYLIRYWEYNISLPIIYCITLIFFLLFIYYLLHYLLIIPNENSKTSKFLNKLYDKLMQYSWFNRVSTSISEQITEGPLNVYEYLYAHIDIRRIVSRLQEFTVYTLESHKEILYLFVFVLIRLSIGSIFLFELIFFKRIVYFYILLILFLVPLITRFLLFFITHNATTNIDEFDTLFDISYREEDDTIVLKDLIVTDPELLEEQKNADRGYVGDLWFFYQQVYKFNVEFQELISKDKYLINCLYYGIMFIGFFIYALIINDIY